MYKFIDKYNLGKPYIYIHPYMQHHVKRLVDIIPDGITHFIVFGSAVGVACKPYSDLDICLIGDVDDADLAVLRTGDVVLDIHHYATTADLREDEGLFREIRDKGVQVYG